MSLYPLKFKPIFVDKIWGGSKLRNILHKNSSDQCGESWEISAVKGNISEVINGPMRGRDLQSLIDEFKGALVGEGVYQKYGNEFPLLIKFLDANDDLSVQVHPNDKQAMEKHGTRGKTEMWYVLEAENGASLIAGLQEGIDRERYRRLFDEGRIMEALKTEEVSAGDVFFIPAGKVHTIGKGILLAEIQETSDITYRIYDFDRQDRRGNYRELHVEQALQVINFQDDPESKVGYDKNSDTVNLVNCEHFTTNRLIWGGRARKDYSTVPSFVIWICTRGQLKMIYRQFELNLEMGESILIPASVNELEIVAAPGSEILEVFIEE